MWRKWGSFVKVFIILSALSFGKTEALVTNFVACLGENYQPVSVPPVFSLVPEDGLGWGTVHVWRRQCYNNPAEYALLMVVVPRDKYAPSLVSGKLIEAWQYGRRVGDFTLKQTPRDLLGYSGYLTQDRAFILASSQGSEFPLDETLSIQLVFTTGGAKTSLWIPGLTPTLDVFQYGRVDSAATLLATQDSKEANLLKNWENSGWTSTGESFATWKANIDGGINMHRFFKADTKGEKRQYFYWTTPEVNTKTLQEVDSFGVNEGAIFAVLYTMPDGSCGDTKTYKSLWRLSGVGGHRLTANPESVKKLVAQGWQLDKQSFCVPR